MLIFGDILFLQFFRWNFEALKSCHW